MSSTEYTDENIQTLSDAAHIRLRPAMYIGCTRAEGFHYFVRGVLDSSTSEMRAGFGDWVGFTLNRDGSCRIEDNGRGIPTNLDPECGLPIIASVMGTVPYGKWQCELPYRGFTGLFGMGTVVTALSEWCEVETRCDGESYQIGFERGLQTEPLRHLGTANGKTGTSIHFKPDPEIFGDHTFDLRTILHTLCELAFLHAGVRFTFTDERTGKTDTFHFPDGLSAFVKYLNTCEEVLHEPIRFVGKVGAISVDAALQYRHTWEVTERAYSNGRWDIDGGTHTAGFRRGLREAMKAFAKLHGCWPSDLPVTPDDIREGITVAISVNHPHPEYEGARRNKLNNANVEPAVAKIVREGFSKHLAEHPELGSRLCQRIAHNAEARIAAREALRRQRTTRLGPTDPSY